MLEGLLLWRALPGTWPIGASLQPQPDLAAAHADDFNHDIIADGDAFTDLGLKTSMGRG